MFVNIVIFKTPSFPSLLLLMLLLPQNIPTKTQSTTSISLYPSPSPHSSSTPFYSFPIVPLLLST